MADLSIDSLPVQDTIREVVRRIAAQFHPDKIILFGSHAHGTAGADSDVDLLVVMHPHGSKRERAVEIYGLLAGMGIPKDVIVVTPEEFERGCNQVGSVVYPAAREGRILYDWAA